MDCASAQDVLQIFHGMAQSTKRFSEKKLEDALEHLQNCDHCQDWLNKTVCKFIKSQFSNGVLPEDVLIGHGMIHEILGNPECICP